MSFTTLESGFPITGIYGRKVERRPFLQIEALVMGKSIIQGESRVWRGFDLERVYWIMLIGKEK